MVLAKSNFGQSNFGRSNFGQSISGSGVCHGPKGGAQTQKKSGPEGWGPKVGSRRVGPRRVGAQNFALFFPSPTTTIVFLLSLRHTHFRPRRFKHHQNSTRRHPREREEKNEFCAAGEGKKARNFGRSSGGGSGGGGVRRKSGGEGSGAKWSKPNTTPPTRTTTTATNNNKHHTNHNHKHPTNHNNKRQTTTRNNKHTAKRTPTHNNTDTHTNTHTNNNPHQHHPQHNITQKWAGQRCMAKIELAKVGHCRTALAWGGPLLASLALKDLVGRSIIPHVRGVLSVECPDKKKKRRRRWRLPSDVVECPCAVDGQGVQLRQRPDHLSNAISPCSRGERLQIRQAMRASLKILAHYCAMVRAIPWWNVSPVTMPLMLPILLCRLPTQLLNLWEHCGGCKRASAQPT